jgi:hypothetical protein
MAKIIQEALKEDKLGTKATARMKDKNAITKALKAAYKSEHEKEHNTKKKTVGVWRAVKEAEDKYTRY